MSTRWVAVIVCMQVLIVCSFGPAQEPAPVPVVEEGSSQPLTVAVADEEVPIEPLPAPTVGTGPIRLNFKDASVDAVLEYLSEAAGLIIVKQAPIEGRITLISHQEIDADEAVGLLNTVLKEKGHAAIHMGRTLKIVPLDQAKTSTIPVKSGNDPAQVQQTDQMITQIIPVRFADAVKLKSDLASLKPEYADLASNADSNALILTATEADVRRMMEIISAIDGRMGSVPEVAVFQLQYADAKSAATLITELFKAPEQQPSGQAQAIAFFRRMRGRGGGEQPQESAADRQAPVITSADARTNTLVVSAPPDLLDIITELVEELDSDPSAEQSVFLYPLKNAQASKLVTVLNDIFDDAARTSNARPQQGGQQQQQQRQAATSADQAAGDLVGQVHVVADEDTNSLLVRTAAKHIDRVKAIIADLDRDIPQVLIKVLIAEVTHDDSMDLGVEFSVLNLRADTVGTFNLDLGGTPDDQSGGLVTTTVSAGLSAAINAMQQEGRLDVLSRPYILASDNQKATITVGQEVPFIRNTRTTDTGQTVNTIEYEDIGIILDVTPHVNPDGLVIMDVAPEISTISDSTVPISETVEATVFTKRSANTRVAVLDGQTIAIGGLMEDRVVDAVREVPYLADIPGLGALFRRTVKRKIKTELLIFLTPHVAKSPKELGRISKAQSEDLEILPSAVKEGAYQKHFEGLQRGGDDEPEEDGEPEADGLPEGDAEPEGDGDEDQP